MGCASGFFLEKPCYGGKGILRFGRRSLFPRGIHRICSFMNHIDPKHSVSAEEKLVWVAPKILLMEAIDTSGKASASVESTTLKGDFLRGPS